MMVIILLSINRILCKAEDALDRCWETKQSQQPQICKITSTEMTAHCAGHTPLCQLCG